MNFKKIIMCVFFIAIMTYMILFPEKAVFASKHSLLLCYEAILPSLFVFLICSSFLTKIGFANILEKPFSKIMSPLFGISGKGALPMILGYISGYPIGSVCICEMYKAGDLKKREAEKMLGFCNNAGPLFIIGSIGLTLLGNKHIGYILYGFHILSSVIVGILFRFFVKTNTADKYDCNTSIFGIRLSNAVTESISSSISSILTICAYTVLFSVIISMSFDFFPASKESLILRGIVEITNGISKICDTDVFFDGVQSKLPIISFILGFGGFCVHLQVISIVKKAGLKTDLYFVGKIIQASLSSLFVLTYISM